MRRATQEELRELVRKREALRAELEAHARECVARGPHGYITCQLVRERLEARLAELETRLRGITTLQLVPPPPSVSG